MPGIDNRRGPLRITPYQLTISNLDPIEKIFLSNSYNSDEPPSKGFIGIPRLDEIGQIKKSNLDNQISFVSARFSIDVENPEIRKKAVTTEDFNSLPNWLKYVQSHIDIISFHNKSAYALVSTTSDDQLQKYENICFNGSCFNDEGILFRESPDAFFVGNDLLLWLLFIRIEKDGIINENTTILDIEYFFSEAEHTIMYSRRSVQEMRELNTSIAEKRPIVKLKIYLQLGKNKYSFVIYSNGRSEIAASQSTAYEEMTEDLVGRRERLILDIYNKCIPCLKTEYAKYPNWKAEREIFRNNIEIKLKSWASST